MSAWKMCNVAHHTQLCDWTAIDTDFSCRRSNSSCKIAVAAIDHIFLQFLYNLRKEAPRVPIHAYSVHIDSETKQRTTLGNN